MQDSTRNRKKVRRFLMSQGGSASSGINVGFVPWMFYKISRQDYSHERVTELMETLQNMERDGELTLDRYWKNSYHCKIIGATLRTQRSHAFA